MEGNERRIVAYWITVSGRDEHPEHVTFILRSWLQTINHVRKTIGSIVEQHGHRQFRIVKERSPGGSRIDLVIYTDDIGEILWVMHNGLRQN